MVNITTIIPFYNPDFERKRNLEFVYNRLKDLNIGTTIALQSERDFIEDYYSKFENVINIKREGFFNKSFIFNYCIDLVKTNFFMLLDADIYFNFSNLLNNVLESDDVVKPFKECVYLDEKLTKEFIIKRNIEISSDLRVISALGGGSIVMKTELIKKHNIKFDENYVGWGFEDFDFGDLLRSKDIKIKTIEQPAAHLYHTPTKLNENNLKYFSKKEKPKSQLVHVFNCCSEDCSHLNNYEVYRNSKVLLMNCGDIDYLNNDNFRFFGVEKNTNGFKLKSVIESTFSFLEETGWILYTINSYNFSGDIYNEIMSSNDKDFIPFYENNNVSGFAVRKNRWKKENIPEIYTESFNWERVILDIFSK